MEGDDFPDDAGGIPAAEVATLWAKFRAGDVVMCPKCDAGAFALAVDGAAKSYRLVCTTCGHASPWFGTTPTGIVVRGPAPTLVPSNAHDE
ncbi:MAG: hypothetical protein JNL38_01530 [Myxococcales bacterium]|nr:hypothetical protein [Myxococcales bacterium]